MWFLPVKVNEFLIIAIIVAISINVDNCNASPTPLIALNQIKTYSPPEISPGFEDVTLDVNSNFMLRCESKEPIRWFYFIEEHHSLVTEEKKYNTQNPDQAYGTELTLSNIDAKYVRYYYCIYEEIETNTLEHSHLEQFIKEGKASKIYVFVNDPNNLLAPGDDFNFHSVYEQTYGTVPCRPTTKDIGVTLTGPNREEFKSKDKNTDFDPHIGFKIFFHGIINSGDYICAPDIQPVNRQHELTFIIHVEPKRESEPDLYNNHRNISKIENNTISTITLNNNSTITTITTTTITPSIATTIVMDMIRNTVKKNKREFSNGVSYHPYSTESSLREFKSEPHIEHVRIVKEPDNRHVIEGDNFNITCEIKRSLGTLLKIDWDHGKKELIQGDGRWHETSETIDNYIVRTTLTIYTSKVTDTGDYKCYASDGQKTKEASVSITVLGINDDYIELKEPTNTYKIEQKRGQKIRIVVVYKGHPKPEIEWLKPDQTKITSSDKLKFDINTDNAKSVLTIKNAQLPDSGNYTVRAYNDKRSKSVQILLLIRSEPIAYLEPIHYAMINESIKLECLVDSFPEPTIYWTFIPCKIEPNWPNCDLRLVKKLDKESETLPHIKNSISYRSILTFTPETPGKVMCSAKNKINETVKETEIRIGDIPDPVFILNPGDDTKIAVGDRITLTCAALAYNYTDSINWFLNEDIVVNSKGIEIVKERTPYSYKTNVNFNKIDHENAGTYECRAMSIQNNVESKSTVVQVYDPVDPILSEDSIKDGSVIYKKMGESAELQCDVTECIPIPTINWFKDNEPIVEDENIGLENENTTLRIRFIRPKDNEGVYKCVISNRLRTVERSAEVKVSDVPVGIHVGWIAAIIILILVLIVFIIILCIRVYKDAQIRKQLKEIGIENFEEGCVGQINESMTLDEQAELLPYDKNRFEFAKEKIHLGKQLGQGAFGVVHKAICDGILPDEKETIVAVKMVKKSADNEVIRALASELKIMVHLGQHLNVVNLLGAVTNNIYKREMMVIVEYCRYGNIQNFLLKNRKRFINQINPETDLIDPAIISNDKRFSSDYEYNSQGLRYVHLVFPNHQPRNNNNNNNINNNTTSTNTTQNSRRISENDPRSGTRSGRPNSQGYIRQSELYYASEVDSAMTQQTVVDGEEVLSNNSVQPVWRSNYKSDSATDTLEITTSHLISWAFQVARGMDYLASRKVLHGDLAARNILLCEDNIVKICDFGLARSVLKNENYQKSEEARLPVKWLALESLGERIFSTRSDIWSFGIVLWEFFSLSKVPYPGIDANGGMLYEKLKDGYRMEKPAYANQELYEIMLECWRANPDSRPLFDELEKRFGRMLEEEVTNHYIDLNEHYLRINQEYQKTNPTDWIALMGSPNEIAPPVPRYVNESIIPEIKIDNTQDYLKMSPKTGTAIFSPRPTSDDYVKASNQFDFARPLSPTTSNNMDSPVMKNRNKDNIIPEEIPMLARQSYSDSEPEQSPSAKDIIKKFNSYNSNTNNSNNSQNNNNLKNSNKVSPMTEGVQQEQQQPSLNHQPHQKFISNDNYVNVKSKAPLAGTDAFTNPSYLILQNANEKKK